MQRSISDDLQECRFSNSPVGEIDITETNHTVIVIIVVKEQCAQLAPIIFHLVFFSTFSTGDNLVEIMERS